MGVYIRGLSRCFGRKLGSGGALVRPIDQLGWLAGQVYYPHRLWASPTYSTDLPRHVYETVFENTPNSGRPAKDVRSAGPTLARLGPGFVPHHLLMSYCLRLCFILDIMKICMDFGPYDVFSSSDIPEMVNQQNSWNLLVISTYLLYLE
jgi:hypothetical protein